MGSDLNAQIIDFVQKVTTAMGLSLRASIEETPGGTRIDLQGDGGEVLLWHRGEPLKALQHIVDSVFRRQLADDRRVHIDCLGFRKDKEAELKQMARFLAERAKATGTDQEVGPLNPYERRLVHLAVAEDPGVTSESVGDAFLKTVIISAKTKL